MATEALHLHIQGMREDRTPLPAPSPLDKVMATAANRQAVAFLVDAPTRTPRPVRVNVMLPADLVTEIDNVATNRSAFLADAARARLKVR